MEQRHGNGNGDNSGNNVNGVNNIAIGAGAVASRPNQVVLGTKNETYKTPGITSSKSRSRQSGALEIVTSDANGNLATDGGANFAQIDQNTAGIKENRQARNKNRSSVALAMAMDNPDLAGNEQFGLTGHYAIFDGASGLGFTALGVVGENFITGGDRFAVSCGFDVGFKDAGDDGWGGRIGGQWTWRNIN
ncbi:MAG: hypothetical protein WBV18_09275 [Methyloceanibacter sp.]|jgi:hypothetical protein|uniref:hypothetical protein n=1 Tax=Methyloceanibacter sp. TaxID=1965321 RepID=UPI003C5E0A97